MPTPPAAEGGEGGGALRGEERGAVGESRLLRFGEKVEFKIVEKEEEAFLRAASAFSFPAASLAAAASTAFSFSFLLMESPASDAACGAITAADASCETENAPATASSLPAVVLDSACVCIAPLFLRPLFSRVLCVRTCVSACVRARERERGGAKEYCVRACVHMCKCVRV